MLTKLKTKGRSILFNHFIEMKTTFFQHEMYKLTVVLMSIKWLNKIERPLEYEVGTNLLSSLSTLTFSLSTQMDNSKATYMEKSYKMQQNNGF